MTEVGVGQVEEGPARPNPHELPAPPAQHWGWVLLFGILTLGIQLIVWQFMQASWVKRVDASSNARKYLLVALFFGIAGAVADTLGDHTAGAAGSQLQGLGTALSLVNTVFFLAANFSMSISVEKIMRPYGVALPLSFPFIFFFNVFYIQGHLTWIARWRLSGQTEPAPPKNIFWLLMLIPLVTFAVLAFVVTPS